MNKKRTLKLISKYGEYLGFDPTKGYLYSVYLGLNKKKEKTYGVYAIKEGQINCLIKYTVKGE